MPATSRRFDAPLAEALKAGAVGIVPTDTLYALACSATHPDACERLFAVAAKIAPVHAQGAVVGNSLEAVASTGIKLRYLRPLEAYWPNPLSVLIPCGDEAAYLHRGKRLMACRVPADSEFTSFLELSGPLLVVDIVHQESAQEAAASVKDELDFFVAAGSRQGQLPATIIRVIDDAIEIEQPGRFEIDEKGVII